MAGIDSWRQDEGQVIMITQTVPHYINQSLKKVLHAANDARRRFRNRKSWKRLAQRIGLAGTVRALEVTHGKNGWHVHFHELLFLPSNFNENLDDLQAELLKMWKSAVTSAGLSEPDNHGIKVNSGIQAGDYVSKWGFDAEMTKAHIKKSIDREKGRTPFDLLRDYGAGDEQAGKLFREYAKCFKGKRQLVWSKGLRDMLALGEEKTDEQLAEEHTETGELIGTFTKDEWVKVCRADARADVLEVAFAEGWNAVIDLIRRL
jgi:hypothetical protein